jgi:hypothetical protein
MKIRTWKSNKQLRAEERAAGRRARQGSTRPKGVGEQNLAADDPRRSFLPRRKPQTADSNARGGNAGKPAKWVQGGMGKTMPFDMKYATGSGKPRSHKSAGWVD